LLFFMLTGARMSEALKLRWEDVNIQGRWLVFPQHQAQQEAPHQACDAAGG
jgi:integrase